jgi:hypothetical protein
LNYSSFDREPQQERRFIVLKFIHRIPTMATCERCHLKFFALLERFGKPVEAEKAMREKFDAHEFKPVHFAHKAD